MFFFTQLFNQSVQEVTFQLMRICYENLSLVFLHILTSLLFLLTSPRCKKSNGKRGIPLPQHLKSIPQPSPTHLSSSHCKWGAKGDYELSCHIYGPFFNFRTLLLNFKGMISDVQQQQQQEEEHKPGKPRDAIPSIFRCHIPTNICCEHQFIRLVQSLQSQPQSIPCCLHWAAC